MDYKELRGNTGALEVSGMLHPGTHNHLQLHTVWLTLSVRVNM